MKRREARGVERHRRGGHVMVALLGSVGLAAGVSAYLTLPQDKQPQPAKTPGAGQAETEKDRLMKLLAEEAAKHGAELKQAETPPAAAPATPPVRTPPAQPRVTDVPKRETTAPKPAASQPPKTGEPDRTPRTSGGKDRPATTPAQTTGAARPMPAAGNVQPGMAAPAPMGADGQPLAPVETPFSDDGKSFVFNFTDATELALIVQYVQQALNLQIIANDSGLLGQKVVLMTPVTVPTDQILPFLTYLLEQKGYTMIRDTRGIYLITPVNQITPQIGQDSSNSTQVIHTPGLKPSAIQATITSLLNANRAAPGGAAAMTQPIFNDDLGVIIMTDTPNNIALVKTIVNELVEQQNKIAITRFPVSNIAASAARDRIIELVGGGGAGAGIGRAPGAPPGAGGAVAAPVGGSISNLAERLSLDASTNALLFRGRTDETAQLFRLLSLVDVPNQMDSRIYRIGNRATDVLVDAARQQQLGEVTYFSSEDLQGGGGAAAGLSVRGRVQAQPGLGIQQSSAPTGAGFVVYPDAGMFVYRGTPQQHARIEAMIRELGPLSEYDDTITYEFIKLKHSKATELAQTVTDLLNSTSASGNRGSLLGRSLGERTRRGDTATARTRELERAAAGDTARNPGGAPSTPGEVTEINSEDVHVLADEPTNQVVVRAPKRLQPQLRALINKLDLRRPQVFIEAKIVAINTSEDFRLAVEVQQVIGQFALNTNFGLGTIGSSTGGSFTDPKNVATNLAGLTTALIRSKDVPIIINAIQTNTDSRILASPQVLVDDNQEATVESLDQQPTLTTTLGSGTSSNNTTQSFGGFEPAGPRLTVKPQISEGGYMKLEFEIELSSFTGSSSVAGVPPPKLENRVRTDSVTVPSDTTIVVGGLQLEQLNTTVNGIPLLKDIPLVGQLFRDTRNTTRNITLYVFITPKIMRDPSFADLRLLTRMPLSESRLDQELPPTEHERIDVLPRAMEQSAADTEATIEEQKAQFDIIRPERKKKPVRKSGTMDSGV